MTLYYQGVCHRSKTLLLLGNFARDCFVVLITVLCMTVPVMAAANGSPVSSADGRRATPVGS